MKSAGTEELFRLAGLVRFERANVGVKVPCLNRLATAHYTRTRSSIKSSVLFVNVGWGIGFEPMVSSATN